MQVTQAQLQIVYTIWNTYMVFPYLSGTLFLLFWFSENNIIRHICFFLLFYPFLCVFVFKLVKRKWPFSLNSQLTVLDEQIKKQPQKVALNRIIVAFTSLLSAFSQIDSHCSPKKDKNLNSDGSPEKKNPTLNEDGNSSTSKDNGKTATVSWPLNGRKIYGGV